MKDGFFRIAAASPEVCVADVDINVDEISKLIRAAAEDGCGAVCFPELAVTGYTCGDLFLQRTLINAAECGLARLMKETADLDILCAVGLPVYCGGALYNCCAVFHRGRLLGLPAKKSIPNYSEFYEARHFSPAPDSSVEISFAGQNTILGDVIFNCEGVDGLTVGVELCEDLWGAEPPSIRLAKAGASVILTPSCSDETIGKAEYRRDLVKMQSGHLACAYVYADSSLGESTTDMVFAGHNIIAENGTVLAEKPLFTTGLITADIDLERLAAERRRMNTWQDMICEGPAKVSFAYLPETLKKFEPRRSFEKLPFVPSASDRHDRCELILTMQSVGLATRLSKISCKTLVINLSGGLDSTLALLAAVRAFDRLGLPRTGIHALSLPCFGTTDRTKSNAQRLAEELGVSFKEISIGKSVLSHFEDIGQSADCLDVTFENSQARERTQVAMDYANKLGGIVLGTGDLSELALGWATYNGDHMSMYGVNASIPKTLVRHLVKHEADNGSEAIKATLYDILDTPVSPELLPPKDGEIAQITEELVGPYELHDFFLYYMLRFGFTPGKIYRMACRTFSEEYSSEVIKRWLRTFYRRFFTQQFKRSCLPDGPKVGTVTLSPRGDFRMPSDAACTLWLKEIDSL